MASTAITPLNQSVTYLTPPEGAPFSSPTYGATIDLGDATSVRLALTITECEDHLIGGSSGQLQIGVEHSESPSGPWRELMAPRRYNAPGSDRFTLGPCERYVRARADQSRGRSKFTITGTAHGAGA